MILNFTRGQTALILAGSTTALPNYFMIGSGSGTLVATQTTLFNAFDRQVPTSTDATTVNKITWQGDWNSNEISGLVFKEFGIAGSASTITGSMYSKIVVPSITFDGTNELRIEETWEVF